MDNLSLKEEMQILNAAKLDGINPPENVDTLKARDFVHRRIISGKPRQSYIPTFAYGILAVAACVAVVLFVFNSGSTSSTKLMQQNQVHAAIDTLDLTKDTLDVDTTKSFELTTLDE